MLNYLYTSENIKVHEIVVSILFKTETKDWVMRQKY